MVNKHLIYYEKVQKFRIIYKAYSKPKVKWSLKWSFIII